MAAFFDFMKKIIYILALFGLAFGFQAVQAQESAQEEIAVDSAQMQKIILFHNEGCGRCSVAKDFFDENHIPYIGKQISEGDNRREMQQWVNKARGGKSGGFSYPVIVLNQDSVYYSIHNIKAFLTELKKEIDAGRF